MKRNGKTIQKKYLLILICLIFGLGKSTKAQPFADALIAPFGLNMVTEIYYGMDLVDIDADGDYDLFQAVCEDYYYTGCDIYFYENLGTPQRPDFAVVSIGDGNPFGMASHHYWTYFRFVDMDTDGDFDLVHSGYENFYSHYDGSKTYYQRNDGSPLAATYATADAFTNIPKGVENFVFPADMDGDGDMDLTMYSEPVGGGTYLYSIENMGPVTALNFNEETELPLSTIPQHHRMIDWDWDGDLDIIAWRNLGGGITVLDYYENSGDATAAVFEDRVEDFLALESQFAAVGGVYNVELKDMDSDGDLDIMATTESGLGSGSVFLYFENLAITSLVSTNETATNLPLEISPNPVADVLSISEFQQVERLSFYDVAGRNIIEISNPGFQVNVSTLRSGIYMIKATMKDGSLRTSKITKQ